MQMLKNWLDNNYEKIHGPSQFGEEELDSLVVIKDRRVRQAGCRGILPDSEERRKLPYTYKEKK